MKYQILDWDSDFFGVKVARITEPNLTMENLTVLLSELKLKCVKLVYWPSTRECNDDKIKKLGGHIVDFKTTLAMDFRCLNLDDFNSTDNVETYLESMPIADIEDLAIQSGEYSRFAVDPNFQREKYVNLYKIWIKRSLIKEIASEVLVIREACHVVGIITLGEKNGRGDIGLIAVGTSYRGKKYGKTLISAAQRWFLENGYTSGQVVTQGTNISACNFYKTCGYFIEKVEYFYHFWL